MNHYVTGAAIRRLREKQRLTQSQLAEKLAVSDKTISKWETGRGFPDISLIEPLAAVLGVSVPELLSGEAIINTNRAANLLRSHLYVCPICGNVLYATGSAMISCCGVTLPPLEAEAPDAAHAAVCTKIEDEIHVAVDHPMTKAHHLTFIAFLNGGRFEFVRLYPEGAAEARFFSRGHGVLFWYCNHHGLFSQKI
jgi:transcriptional regulator with XRE-family HTH domain/desulfoferrodoxin (superoxide reductase-like protein)